MKLLLYSNGSEAIAERLLKSVSGPAHGYELEVYKTTVELRLRLVQRRGDLAAVILCACTTEDLTEIVGFCDLFLGLRIILVLPDRDSNTLARGLALRPRFFSFVDTDFKDVSTVLAKMLRIYGKESISD